MRMFFAQKMTDMNKNYIRLRERDQHYRTFVRNRIKASLLEGSQVQLVFHDQR